MWLTLQTLYDDNLMAVRVEWSLAALFIHVEWRGGTFTKQKYYECVHIFDAIAEFLKEHGVEEVFSLVDKSDKKAMKWQKFFEMLPLAEFHNSVMFRRKL